MKFTVVICTYNRSSLLMRTIESLNQAARPVNCDLSLLIVANTCTDDSVIHLQRYRETYKESNNLPLEFEEEKRPGKSHALNHAIESIEDGYLCFVDDDHRVDINYFASISMAIKTYEQANIFCGRIIPDWSGREPDWVHMEGKFRIYPLPIPDFQLGNKPLLVSAKTRLPGGGNLIVHRSIFESTGLFSTELGPKGHDLLGSEDSEFILRALSVGEVIQYIPDIIQYHYVDNNRLKLSYLVVKSFQRTRSITLATKPAKAPIPRYLWRKLMNYFAGILFSFNVNKIRFYLMRFASTMGEMMGTMESTRQYKALHNIDNKDI